MRTKSLLTPAAMKEWRKRMEWRQTQAARQLGLGVSSISTYEQGKRADSDKPVKIPRVVALAMMALEKLTHKDFSDWGMK